MVMTMSSDDRLENAWSEIAAMPAPTQLAALGSVLWVCPPELPHPLDGWERAVRAEAHALIDAVGVREWVAFLDANGDCRGRLHLLPDTDFLAWEALIASLARGSDGCEPMPLCRRLRMRSFRGRWRAIALRLRAVARARTDMRMRPWTLHARPTPLSAFGLEVAHAIVRAEDAEPMLAPPPDAAAQPFSPPSFVPLTSIR
jgi:hypothetical protein